MVNEKELRQMKAQCLGKLRHSSMLSAEYLYYQMKDNADLNIYKCQFCQGYHIGHKKPKHKEKQPKPTSTKNTKWILSIKRNDLEG